MSVTPSKARLIGFGCEWKFQYVAIERTCKAPLRFTLYVLTTATVFGDVHLQDGQDAGLRGLSEEYV